MSRLHDLARGVLCLAIAAVAIRPAQDSVALEPGKPVERSIADDLQIYEIRCEPDTFVGVRIEQRGVDVSERLFAPNGELVAEFDDELRPRGSESAAFVAVQGGACRLEVRPKIRGLSGRYEIRVTEVRAATEHDRLLHQVRILASRAGQLTRRAEFGQAVSLARQALAINEKLAGPHDAMTGSLLNLVGGGLLHQGEYEQAEESLRRALDILGVEHPASLRSLRLLGSIHSERGENAQAEPLFQRALDLTERALGADHPEVARCLLDSSSHHRQTGEFPRAEKELRRAAEVAGKALDDRAELLPMALNNLAVLYNSQREYGRAEPLLNQAVEIVEKSAGPDSPGLALPFQNLALIAQEKRKDYPRALDLYSRAISLLERGGGPDSPKIPAILNNMGNIYRATGEYARAVEVQQRVYAIAQKQAGDYSQLTLVALGNLARTYAASGDVENALDYQTRVDETVERDLALNLAIGSERQKLAYFASLAERTSRTISLQVGLAAHAPRAAQLAALTVLQRKGRVFDAMSGSFAALRQRLKPEEQRLFDDWNEAAGQYARLALAGPGRTPPAEFRKQLAALEARRDSVEAEMSGRSAEFRAQSRPVTLEAVQAAIPRGAALIEFAVYRPFNPALPNSEAYGEPRYMAYILRREGGVAWRELGPAAEIDRAVATFRDALRDPHRSDVESLAREIDRKVMAPVRAAAAGATQLLIAPDGALNLVPIQALVDEQGRYFVERYSISYLTSGRDLLRLQEARPPRSAPLVIADPYFGEPAESTSGEPTATRRSVTAAADLASIYFAPLAGTAQEAHAIQSRFPEARVLTGREATESALKAADAPRILHIATHGFFLHGGSAKTGAAANPLLRSGLALSGANLRAGGTDDGIFTALEASGLNLWGTSLVTLSACDTGVGEVKTGDGVYGLRRAFFLAGAESLVMSLWPVSDYVTRETMTAYYAGLKAGLGRGEALRQAQLAVRKHPDRRHPFYWAGFIQAGEWKSLEGK